MPLAPNPLAHVARAPWLSRIPPAAASTWHSVCYRDTERHTRPKKLRLFINTAKPRLRASSGKTGSDATCLAYQRKVAAQYFKNLPTWEWLAEEGVLSSNSTGYSLSRIQEALKEKQGALPWIGCAGPIADAGRTVVPKTM